MINSETDLFFAIGGAVLHFLWQGTAIGLISALLIRVLLHKSSSESRYAVALCSLVICLIVFLITFWGLVCKIPNIIGVLVTPITLIPIANNNSFGMQQIVATIWVIGVGLLIAKFTFHWLWSQRFRTRMVANPDGQWTEIFNELKTQMGISKSVKMLKSGLVQTPMVVGWILPVVLVPVAAFASLSPEQMRMILVHELMHIRRYDHWVNQFQALVEIILFFHPVVWWLSRQMKIEREYCCDDASLKAVPKPKLMAQTLAQLEQMRISSPANILAADGGSLMDRITRILDNRVRTKETNKHKIKIQTLGVIAAAALLVGGIFNIEAKDTKKVQISKKQPAKAKLNNNAVIKKIMAAVWKGYSDKVEKYLDSGANVNEQHDGTTLLHIAAFNNRHLIAEKLIVKGAMVNAKDKNGGTPLHVAGPLGHNKIVELLINNGAELNSIILSGKYKGKAPLDLAKLFQHPKTVEILRKNGAKTALELKAKDI